MISTPTVMKFVASEVAAVNRINILTGVSLKLFTFASLVTLILLVSKITGLLSIGWFAVFLPVVGSFAIGTFFTLLMIVVVAVAKFRS